MIETRSSSVSFVKAIGWISAAAAAKLIEDPYLNSAISTSMMFRGAQHLIECLPGFQAIQEERSFVQLALGTGIAAAGAGTGQVLAEKVHEVFSWVGIIGGTAAATWATYSKDMNREIISSV